MADDARFCSGCGTELGVVALEPLDRVGGPGARHAHAGGPAASDRSAAVVGPGRSRRALVGAVAVVALGALAAMAAWRDGGTGDAAQGGDATGPAAAESIPANPPTTAEGAAAAPTSATDAVPRTVAVPARVAIPAGLSGTVVALTDTVIVEVDLATGATRQRTYDEIGVSVYEATDATPIAVTGALFLIGGGRLIRIPDGAAATDTFAEDTQYAEALAQDGDAVLVMRYRSGGEPEAWLLRGDGSAVELAPRARDAVYDRGAAGLRGGLVVANVGQAVAIIDPADGRGSLVADGVLVAADAEHVARVVCRQDLQCALHAGGYGDPDEHIVELAPDDDAGAPWYRARLTADGRRLLQRSYRDGDAVITVTDLVDGHRAILPTGLQAANDEPLPDTTADGRFAVAADRIGRLVLVPLDGSTPVPVDLGGTGVVRAVALRR